jgi:hypothetical protein
MRSRSTERLPLLRAWFILNAAELNLLVFLAGGAAVLFFAMSFDLP